MLAAALADGTAPASLRVRGVRPPAARRAPLRRRRRHRPAAGRASSASGSATHELARLARGRRPRRPSTGSPDYRFTGDVDGYPEGELYFPGSPILTVSGTFAEAVLLETLALSILNHDCAVASAAARMVTAAAGRPIIEMGSRRTHEQAAVAAARAAYLAGFAATSNLEAGRRYGIPTAGTAAHAFMLLHDDELAAFAAQVAALGAETTLLVDTFDIRQGIEPADRGGRPGARRRPHRLRRPRRAGPPGPRAARRASGATGTRIVLSGDLDEYAIAALRAEPVDSYGVGTSVVTGSGAPTAGWSTSSSRCDGRPVAKRSASQGVPRRPQVGAAAVQADRDGGGGGRAPPRRRTREPGPHDRVVPVPLMRGGEPVPDLPTLEQSREHLRPRW